MKIWSILTTLADRSRIQAEYPSNVSHKCQRLFRIYFSFTLPSFISLFLHFILSFLLPRLVRYFFLLFFHPPFLSLAKKNSDKEFNGTEQIQCRPEGDNKHFNCTVVIRTVYLKRQSLCRLAMGWTVRETNPGGREFFCNRLDWTWSPASLL